MTKYNDEEMAKYAKTFNQLCEKNKITSFCWPQNPDGSNKNETPYWNDARDSQILSEVFENLMSFKGKLNAPIICGEYAAWPKKIDMDTRAGK